MLVALDDMRDDPSTAELLFMVRAWKAVFEKARALGWLN
jgi:hypothetical protein